MVEFLFEWTLWIKSLHVISVIAWMAGLFYLPRLYVYHVEVVGQSGETHEMFKTMERRLLKAIMNPAMISTWLFGLLMAGTPGLIDWTSAWPWVKSVCVLAMTWFHMWCGSHRKKFEGSLADKPGRYYRLMNEVPTVLMVVIVISVIVKF